MMRRILVILFLFLPAGVFSQNNCRIREVQFIPPTFYVGDDVTLRITVEPSEQCRIEVPQEIPEDPYVTIHDVDVVPVDEDVRIVISFSTYFPGERRLPSLRCGELSVPDIGIEPASISEDLQAGVQPMREQLLLPGTRIFMMLLIIAGVVLVVLAVMAAARGKNAAESVRRGVSLFRHKKKLMRLMETVEAEFTRLGAERCYKLFSDAIRGSIEIRLSLPGQAMTTSELKGELQRMETGAQNPATGILEVLERSDRIRYGGFPVSAEILLSDIGRIRKYLRGRGGE